MELEIEFFEGPPELEVGSTKRLRVVQTDTRKVVSLVRVQFKFMPIEWGRVRPTDDPGVGVLEVVQMMESDDPLLAPAYTVQLFLTSQANVTFQAERKIRIVPTALEIELGFEVEKKGRSVRFGPQDLSRPIDWGLAKVGNPETQSLFLREGRPFLRVSPVIDFPLKVEITFPNGESATLELQGEIQATSVRADTLVDTGAQSRVSSGPQGRAGNPQPPPGASGSPAAAHHAARQAAAQQAHRAAQQQAAQQQQVAQQQAAKQQAAQVAQHQQAQRAQAAQQPAREQREGEALREELNRLHRYIGSFSSAQRRDMAPRQASSIRDRMQREVDQVREGIEAYRGQDRDELMGMLATISEGLSEWSSAERESSI